MKIADENMVKDQAPVKGISGVRVPVEGEIKLLMTLGTPLTTWTQYVQFFIVKLPLAYNVILGRSVLYDFEVATSIKYLCMKFPTEAGVAIVRGRQEESRMVHMATTTKEENKEVHPGVIEVRNEEKEQRTQPTRELESFILNEEEPEKIFNMNAKLTREQKTFVKA